MLVGFLWVWKDTTGVRAQLCLNENFKLELSLCKNEWEKDGSRWSTWEMLAIHLTFHTGGYFLEFKKTWWIVDMLIPLHPPPHMPVIYFLSCIIRNLCSEGFINPNLLPFYFVSYDISPTICDKIQILVFCFITHFRSGSHLNTLCPVCLSGGMGLWVIGSRALVWCECLLILQDRVVAVATVVFSFLFGWQYGNCDVSVSSH